LIQFIFSENVGMEKFFRFAIWTTIVILASFWVIYITNFLGLYDTYSNWFWKFSNFPHLFHALTIVAFIAAAFLARNLSHQWATDLICSVIATVPYFTIRIKTMGDSEIWSSLASSNKLHGSEFLSNAAYSQAFRHGLSLDYVAPAFGFFSCFAYLCLGRLIVPNDNLGRLAFRLSYFGAGFSMLYFSSYIENTQLALPFSLMATYFLAQHISNPSAHASLAIGTFFLLCAMLFHGQNVFLLPAFILVILAARLGRDDPLKKLGGDLLTAVTVTFLTMAAFYFSVITLGYELLPGNVTGGSDEKIFVPIYGFSQMPFFFRFYMYSAAHLSELSNIVVHSTPLILVFFPYLCLRLFISNQKKGVSFSITPVVLVSGSMAACFLAFISLWNFDLGFPTDLDLMVSMSFGLSLVIFSLLYQLIKENKKILISSILLTSMLNLWFISGFLSPRFLF
jgi:hypothetical protein